MQTQPAGAKASDLLRLLKPFTPWIALSSVTGIGAGVATVALLATINEVLSRPGGMAGGLLLTFVALCAVALVGRAISDISNNVVGQRLVAQVRKDLAQKILAAPIDALERYRMHRLMPVLTQDVDMISDWKKPAMPRPWAQVWTATPISIATTSRPNSGSDSQAR
jgi:putative ATP-binding cassette transporter